jgi:hypothetical protein
MAGAHKMQLTNQSFNRIFPTLAALCVATTLAAQNETVHLSNRPALPVGTSALLELRNIINTHTALVGQQFSCTTISPIVENNRILIPAGSFVHGQVTHVERPRKVKGHTQLALRFDSVTLPNGITKPLAAALVGFSTTRTDIHLSQREVITGDSSWRSDLAGIAISSSQSAMVGAMSGMSGGDSGIWSGVTGGASGVIRLAHLLVSRSDDFVLVPGTTMEIRLEAPVAFSEGEITSASESRTELAQIANH